MSGPTRRAVTLGLGALPVAAWAARAETSAPLPGRIAYGWDPEVAGPTEATIHVSPLGDDAASGTADAPVRTIQRGVTLLARRPGGSLAIRGGTYREQVSLDALHGTAEAPYLIHRYGRERVTITAAEPLEGWSPCPPEEAASLGFAPEGVHVARLPRDALAHDAPEALNLHVGGLWQPTAIDRADMSDPTRTRDEETYHRTRYLLDDENRILGLLDTRLIGRRPEHLRDVRALIYHSANNISSVEISSFDPARGVLILADPGLKLHGTREDPVMRYALQGAGWALRPGSWIARRGAGGVVSVYFHSSDGAPPRGAEVSLRPTCLELGAASHLTLLGLEAIRAAGGHPRHSGICLRGLSGQTRPGGGAGIALHHCRMGETQSTSERAGYGAIALRDMTGLTMRHVTVEDVRDGYGVAVLGAEAADLRYLHVARATQSPLRFYGWRRSVVAFSLLEKSGQGAHSNKINFYEGSDLVLAYGLRFRDVGGYATYQEASRIHFAFCELPVERGVHDRALASQNRPAGSGQGGPDGSGDPVLGTTFYCWNNTMLPVPGAGEKAGALSLGPLEGSQRHAVFNNILHGGGFRDLYTKGGDPTREIRSHNRYTALAWWQRPKHGWDLGPMEETASPGLPIRGRGRDMRDLIAREIAPHFPGFTNWDRDLDGRPVDWAAAPIGCRV